MLQKVKWRLTLINITVIGSIVIVFSMAIYWGSPRNDALIMDQMLNAVQHKEVLNSERGFFKHGNQNENIMYVQLDAAGTLKDQTFSKKLSTEQLNTLIQEVGLNKYSGKVELSNKQSFYFLKMNLDNDQGTTLILLEQAVALMQYLFKSVPLIAITLFLVFLGSWFISGKALIPARIAWQKQIDFTADASHELRTPITVIQTNLELVMGNPEETVESQKKWLDNIMMENKRLTYLVNDLLTLSRANTNGQSLCRSMITLDKVLLEAVIPFEPQAALLEIDFIYNLEQDTYFWGDPGRLKQLIIILIDNALHYTDRSGQILVQLMKKEKTVELTVSDTGVGIEAEHLDKIFDRFYRIDKARSRDGGGSGLGLAIARWIVEEHHGSIQAVSNPGEGTSFRISMPILKC